MTNKRDSLGDRMKGNYEDRSKTYLLRRTPVIIRLDGRSFHTFTRGFVKPFDERLMETMQETTLELCKNIQGCVFGYTQFDEITLILVDYYDIDVSAWYDYSVQKMCSVSASMATLFFNKIFRKKVAEFVNKNYKVINKSNSVNELVKTYNEAIETGGMFDSRCFNVPESEVVNMVLWRQMDASRNSVYSLARSVFKHGQLQGKTGSQMQDMLMETHGINWNDLSTVEKRGTAVLKDENDKWYIDKEMPILKGEDRMYLEKLIKFE